MTDYGPAGWYPQPDGSQRYWDGAAWTEHIAPPLPPPQPQPPQVAAAPPTSTNRSMWVILGAVAVLLVIGAIVATSSGKKSTATTPTLSFGSSTHEVSYQASGTARGVDVTISTPSGTSSHDSLALPLRDSTTGKLGINFTAQDGEFLYISAQNTGESGSVTCMIVVDGVTIAKNTSSGAYTIAQCDGTA